MSTPEYREPVQEKSLSNFKTDIAPKPSAGSSTMDFLINHRFFLLVMLHVLLFTIILWCAFMMRFTQVAPEPLFFSLRLVMPEQYVSLFMLSVIPVVMIKVSVFLLMRSFRGWWRHVNFSDLISLVKSSVVAAVVLFLVDQAILPGQIPRMVLVNDLLVSILVLGALRSVWRVWDERIAPLDQSRIKNRALLLGNQIDDARVAHMINGQLSLKTRILGLVSPGEYRRGTQFSDLRVVGKIDDLPELMMQHRANRLFVIAGSIPAKQLRDLLDSATRQDFQIKILPTLNEQLRGVDQLPIREVSCEDLLRRQPAELNLDAIESLVADRTILVTGAGGSIGSELCRQLSRFHPKEIVLLGRGENRIFHIERELLELGLPIKFTPRITNITDEPRMREVFETHCPDIVFHAAAHKHVPLVEKNVGESIVNNILGTKVVADLADEYNVERFVMISTDKAVNPSSMMGCTKQMAERYCQALGSQSRTRFISTRFGNVLGSAGSVVPIFQKQIQQGGPITITDSRMTRYFMTIPEATQLVIQSASMGSGGEIFVLEMGEPVKIVDLAKDLIRLAGHSPDSIDIVESGMRPGEKLFEELYYENEQSLPTEHNQILSSHSRVFSFEEVESQVQRLISVAYHPTDEIRALMHDFVPEFISSDKARVLTQGK